MLRPLPGLPVIRDLIVDMTQFFKQYHSIKPYLVNDTPPPEKERLQSPEERDELERPVRVHPVRVLLDVVPVVLVEPRQVRRPGRPAAGLPLHRRQPRPGDRRAPRQPRRPVPPVPLPHDHELRRRLPEGPEPDDGDRQDQGTDGAARGLMTPDPRSRTVDRMPAGDRRARTAQAALALPARPAGERPVHRALLRRARGDADATQARCLDALMDLADNDLLDLLLAAQRADGELDRPRCASVAGAAAHAALIPRLRSRTSKERP